MFQYQIIGLELTQNLKKISLSSQTLVKNKCYVLSEEMRSLPNFGHIWDIEVVWFAGSNSAYDVKLILFNMTFVESCTNTGNFLFFNKFLFLFLSNLQTQLLNSKK